MKRLLCIVGGMDRGGAETFLMKIYRNLDRSQYQMDFAVTRSDECAYDKEILQLGGKIHHITPKSHGAIKNFRSIVSLVKKEQYKYVLRTSQHSLSALELLAARMGGAKVTVFRSSNSNDCAGKVNAILHRICKFMPQYFANVRIAPSTEAARFMFGNRMTNNGKVQILHNAVNHELFRYNEDVRQKYRAELGLQDNFVVGHVGRFNFQKNHSFLIDVFKEIKAIKPNAKLVLVGKGEKEDEVKAKVASLGLQDDVVFLGVRNDVNLLLSAFDVKVFPSLFEGMPNTVIEAEAASLPCVISDTITKEADITRYVHRLSLSESAATWATTAVEAANAKRESTLKEFQETKYEIKDSVETFCRLIFNK